MFHYLLISYPIMLISVIYTQMDYTVLEMGSQLFLIPNWNLYSSSPDNIVTNCCWIFHRPHRNTNYFPLHFVIYSPLQKKS